MTAPIFIVGTGRCGSTLMSRIVREHPAMLSASEFLTGFDSRVFVGDRATGEQMCERLTVPSPMSALILERNPSIAEVLYRFGPDARYRPGNLPGILRVTLPLLTDDPDGLLDELLAAVGVRGEHSLGDHYRFLLDWLRAHFGRRVWVERSGASLRFVPALVREFPEARYVHIFRDGRDVALSMRRHPAFLQFLHLAVAQREAGMDPFCPDNTHGLDPFGPFLDASAAEAHARGDLEEDTGPADPLAMGWYWNGMIEAGLGYLARIPSEKVLTLRYEDIVSSPREELGRFARWVGPEFEDADWLDAAAKIPVRRPSPWRALPEKEREALTAACAPGLRRLGYLAGEPGIPQS